MTWRTLSVVAVVATALAGLTGCGGDSTVTREDVVAELQDEMQLTVSLDIGGGPHASLLTPEDTSFGHFSIWVYDRGAERPDLDEGDVEWDDYEPYGSELPGRGTYAVRKAYGTSLLLLYLVEGGPPSDYSGYGYPPSPDGLVLLDETLSALTETEIGTGPRSG